MSLRYERKKHASFHPRAISLLEQLEHRLCLDAVTGSVLVGDFDADGTDTVAFYDPAAGDFLINNLNAVGVAETRVHFGPKNSTNLPVVGDFDGDGTDTIGLYEPFTGTFFLKNDNAAGSADEIFRFGPKGDRGWFPLSGDFNGDGSDEVALYDPFTARTYVNGTFAAGVVDEIFRFGKTGATEWMPLTGDWDGDGDDGLGTYRPDLPVFYLQHTPGSLGTVENVVTFGPRSPDVVPIVGDWNGDGFDTVGIYDRRIANAVLSDELFHFKLRSTPAVTSQFFLATSASDGAPAIPKTSRDRIVLDAAVEDKTLAKEQVEQLLQRAAGASSSEDAIIAIVDRGGRILGVRVEQDVLDTIPDVETRVFAIDGAVAKARTAAFFANDAAPLSSRLIRFISQSTVTEREVEANPNLCDPDGASYDEFLCGPGFVAPIGLGGHFPPEVPHTPVVDLFAIEHTNRDSIVHPGPDHIRGTADDLDFRLPDAEGDTRQRFNVKDKLIATGQQIHAPESYGFVSGMMPQAQSRGIGTMPGGLGIYKFLKREPAGGPPRACVSAEIQLGECDPVLVGGIGVFFPGEKGFATHEQAFRTTAESDASGIARQTEKDRTNSAKALEAEWIALAVVGGTLDRPIKSVSGTPAIEEIRLPLQDGVRLTLVGIELEIVGPHPDGKTFHTSGIDTILAVGLRVHADQPSDGDSGMDFDVDAIGTKYLDGEVVPDGWLVLPHSSSDPADISGPQVQQIIRNAIDEANKVRAAIRLQPDFSFGARTRMVLAVADRQGNVLGVYRMPDATFFSIDVAVTKARNTAYYADTTALVDADKLPIVDRLGTSVQDAGVAFSNRTFRFVAEPRFPDGVEGTDPLAFSILNDTGVRRAVTTKDGGGEKLFETADTIFRTASTSVLGYDAFNVGSNFRDPDNVPNQSGIVFFPGSTPVYSNNQLIGGFGVSGDGVDQDDVVTFFGAQGFFPTTPLLRADQVFISGVRLPFIKFLRNPEG